MYAQKVLQMNFDPNVQHDNGYTALAYAAMKGNGRMVELLLRNGADPGMVTREGDTPVELALRLGHSRGGRHPEGRPHAAGRGRWLARTQAGLTPARRRPGAAQFAISAPRIL